MVTLGSETVMISKSVFVDWIRCSKSYMFFESEQVFRWKRERELLSVNSFKVCSWSISLITFSGVSLISEEKELNSLNKCVKFLGFNVKHDSFKSLLQKNRSVSKEWSLKLFTVVNGNKSLLQLQQCHVLS